MDGKGTCSVWQMRESGVLGLCDLRNIWQGQFSLVGTSMEPFLPRDFANKFDGMNLKGFL